MSPDIQDALERARFLLAKAQHGLAAKQEIAIAIACIQDAIGCHSLTP